MRLVLGAPVKDGVSVSANEFFFVASGQPQEGLVAKGYKTVPVEPANRVSDRV
jgi:hypothetical protein